MINDLEVLLFLVPFWCQGFDIVWCRVRLSYFDLFSFKYFNGATCLIFINLCTFHVKKNSARLQWYSCARYKTLGPLFFSFHFSGEKLCPPPTFRHRATPLEMYTCITVFRQLNFLGTVIFIFFFPHFFYFRHFIDLIVYLNLSMD